eukprot:1307856-Rhodomonas_salina.1
MPGASREWGPDFGGESRAHGLGSSPVPRCEIKGKKADTQYRWTQQCGPLHADLPIQPKHFVAVRAVPRRINSTTPPFQSRLYQECVVLHLISRDAVVLCSARYWRRVARYAVTTGYPVLRARMLLQEFRWYDVSTVIRVAKPGTNLPRSLVLTACVVLSAYAMPGTDKALYGGLSAYAHPQY